MASPRPFTSADRPPPQYDDDDSWDDDEKFLFDTFVRPLLVPSCPLL